MKYRHPCPYEAAVRTENRLRLCPDCYRYWHDLWDREGHGARVWDAASLVFEGPCGCTSVAHEDDNFVKHDPVPPK